MSLWTIVKDSELRNSVLSMLVIGIIAPVIAIAGTMIGPAWEALLLLAVLAVVFWTVLRDFRERWQELLEVHAK